MSIKRKNNLLPEVKNKKQRKAIDLEMKMKIINAHEAEERVRGIARQFGLAHSTVSTILKDKERIKEAAKSAKGLKLTILRKRKGLIHKMETLLAIWYDDLVQKGNAVSLFNIRKKALSIFETLKKAEGDQCTENFIASNGWLQRFRKRFNFSSKNYAVSFVKEKTTEEFIKELESIIADEHYKPEQIFNVAQTSFFWKKLPETYFPDKTKLCNDISKDRISLLLGGNIVGFKLKPFLVCDTKNSSVIKNSKHHKLVYYRESNKAWMSSDLFEDWFLNCFVPVTMHYCLEKGIPNKVLLILVEVPWHPINLSELHPNVKIVYLPKKSRSIIEPMSLGAITVFKGHYIKTTFLQAITSTKDEETKVRDFWKSYDISQCVQNIAVAWENVSEKCMQEIWKNCLKHDVDNCESFSELDEIKSIKKSIIELAKTYNVEIEAEDIDSLVEYNVEELTNEDLMILGAQDTLNNEEYIPIEIQKKFTIKGLNRVFYRFRTMMSDLEDMDEDEERLSNVRRQMNEILQCYKDIYKDLKSNEEIKKKSESLDFSHNSLDAPLEPEFSAVAYYSDDSGNNSKDTSD